MHRFALVVALLAVLSVSAHAQRQRGVIFVEESDFGTALQAAILKKKVPLVVTTNKAQASLFLEETSRAEKEGTGERVAKVLAFGAFAGSGRSYEASVRLLNTQGTVLFAHNSKKGDIRRAAEDVANKLKDFVNERY